MRSSYNTVLQQFQHLPVCRRLGFGASDVDNMGEMASDASLIRPASSFKTTPIQPYEFSIRALFLQSLSE